MLPTHGVYQGVYLSYPRCVPGCVPLIPQSGVYQGLPQGGVYTRVYLSGCVYTRVCLSPLPVSLLDLLPYVTVLHFLASYEGIRRV